MMTNFIIIVNVFSEIMMRTIEPPSAIIRFLCSIISPILLFKNMLKMSILENDPNEFAIAIDIIPNDDMKYTGTTTHNMLAIKLTAACTFKAAKPTIVCPSGLSIL